MLEFVNYERLAKTKPFATDLLLKFKDWGVNKEEYTFIKNRLNNYNVYIDDEHSMSYDTQYDELKELLLIGLIITIPDRLMPKDAENLEQIISDQSDRFPKFYQRNIEAFDHKNGKE